MLEMLAKIQKKDERKETKYIHELGAKNNETTWGEMVVTVKDWPTKEE